MVQKNRRFYVSRYVLKWYDLDGASVLTNKGESEQQGTNTILLQSKNADKDTDCILIRVLIWIIATL